MSTRLPNDDDAAELGGLDTNETPDEISMFLSTNGIADKYQMVLKEVLNSGKPQYIRGFSNWHPTIDDIGEQWGPGEYEITFSWKETGIGGKKQPVAKSFKINLPEKAWGPIHQAYLEKRREEQLEKDKQKIHHEAERARAYGQTAAPQGASDLDTLKKAAETLRSLGVPLGGPAATPKTDWASVLVGLAPVMAALAPVASAFITRKREDSQGPLLQLLISKMLDHKPQGESEYMKQAFGFVMGTMKNMLEVKQQMQPEEKEPFIERVFDKLVGSMPMLMELAKLSKSQRENSMMYQMAKSHPDVQAVLGDVELQIAFVNKLDKFYGFEQTNQILEVMGVPRPPVTAENAKHYPSPNAAKPSEGSAEATQENLRDVPGKVSENDEDELT